MRAIHINVNESCYEEFNCIGCGSGLDGKIQPDPISVIDLITKAMACGLITVCEKFTLIRFNLLSLHSPKEMFLCAL